MNKYVKIGLVGFGVGALLTTAHYLSHRSPYEDKVIIPTRNSGYVDFLEDEQLVYNEVPEVEETVGKRMA